MTKEFVKCPACGSRQITRYEKNALGKLTLGAEFLFKEIYYVCDSCKEEGDFLAETDKNYLQAQKESQINLVKQILEDINKIEITMAMFERVFELPSRTLTRWKGGDFSSSALALLRLIVTYPWILQVAEHRFEKNYARYAVITAAAQEIKTIVSPSQKQYMKMASPPPKKNTRISNTNTPSRHPQALITESGGQVNNINLAAQQQCMSNINQRGRINEIY